MIAFIGLAVLYVALGIIDVCEVQSPWPKDGNRVGMAIGTAIVIALWLPLKLYASVHGRVRRGRKEWDRDGPAAPASTRQP